MAQSDSEVESVHSQASIGSPSQKFIPEDDDEETLWEVEAITAEKGNQYKVKWVGIDPMTNKPWTQSWVPKKDCTPDLVMVWKLKKKEAERRKSTASNRGRSSTATRKGGRASTASTVVPRASTSKLSDARRSTSTTRPLANEREVVTSKRGRSSGIPLSTTSTVVSPDQTRRNNAKSKSKSKRAPDPIPEADVEVESEEEVVSAASKTRAKSKAMDETTTVTKGKKRKLDDAQSANNSARAPTVDVNINSDDDKVPISKRVSSRPKKKRKIEVDLVEPKVQPVDDDDEEVEKTETETEAEEPRRSVSLSQSTRRIALRQEEEEESEEEEEESYPARRLRGKVDISEEDEETQQKVKRETDSDNEGQDLEEEEEEEVRMVEEVLSEGIGTPPPTDYRDDVDVNMSNDEREVRKSRVHESESDKTSGMAKSAKPNPQPTNATASSSHNVGPPSRKSLPTGQAGPSAPGVHGKTKSKNNAQSKSTVLPPNAKPTNSPPKAKLQHMQATRSGVLPKPHGPDLGNKGRRGRNTGSDNTSESNDDDDRPPPLFYPSTTPSAEGRYTLPMAERSVFWEDRNSSETNAAFADREKLPIEERLMPGDIARLEQFDDEMKILSQLSKKREVPAKEAHAVQGSSKDDVAQASRRADVRPTVASSSKGKEKAEIIIIDTESEQDERPTVKKTTSVVNKSSAPTRDSSSKQIQRVQRREPELANPAPAAHEREVEGADARSNDSKVSKKTASSSNLKSSVATATNGTKQRSIKPPTNSYEHETIPETEVEQSQSQSQEKQKTKGLDIDLTPPGQPTYPTLLHPPPPSTPGGRSTLKSKMRPKTPSSRNSSLSVTGKPLGPIRMLSPSVFHPHLPRVPEPTSSLPESISDVVDSAKHPSSKISTQVDNEDVQMESIEEFESPEKPARPAAGPRTKLVASNWGQRQSAEEVWESDVVKRGQEIAETAKRRAAFEAGVSETRPKKTLDEIRAAHSRKNSNASDISEIRPTVRAGGLVQETIVEEEDEDMQDVSTAVLPPGSGPRVTSDDSATLREMEEAYVDLSGGAGAENENTDSTGVLPSSAPHIALRQEEEESTQEAMHTMMDDVVFQVSKATSSEDAVAQLALDSAGASNDGGSEHIPTIVVQDASRPASPRPYSDDSSQVGNMRTTRSRSRSQTPALVPRTTKNGGKGKAKATSLGVSSDKTSRAGSLAPPEKASSSTSRHYDDDVQARLNSALALVESKSQELKKFEAELVSQQIKNQEELDRLRAVTEKQQAEIASSITQFADAQKEWKSQMVEAEAKSSQRLAEKEAEWEVERSRLVAQLDAATKSKESSDKDRDFFREQYAQASGYVTAVRDENKDLEKRIKIAEDQAQSGVKLIKATFEARVQNLETDLKSWRRMAEFLIEKDKRTDNDELRRRAAEHPELASLCDRQRRTVNDLEEQIDDLKEEAEIRGHEMDADKSELERWKKETTRLMIELSEAQNKLKRIAQAGDDDESGDTSANEFVYPCQWRIYDGAESTSCNEFFSTISELEQHLLSGDHLHT